MSDFKKLNQKLAQKYPKEVDARRILKYADIPTDKIVFDSNSENMWFNIMTSVEDQGLMPQLLKEAFEDASPVPPTPATIITATDEEVKKGREDISTRINKAYQFNREDLDVLIANGKLKDALSKLSLIADSLSRDYKNEIIQLQGRYTRLENDNAGGILTRQEFNIEKNRIGQAIMHNIDQIPNEEKIKNILANIRPQTPEGIDSNLNVDSSALEKVLGDRDDIVEIDWLSKALEASKSVCKIQLNDGSAGTGWILNSKFIMTNNHVLGSVEDAKNARAIFNFQIDNLGKEKALELDPDELFLTDETLDYALVKVKDDGTLKDYGTLELETFEVPQVKHLVNIIQHPKGKSKKIAMPDEIISVWAEKNYLFYLADTEPGSSGSPVFNQNWKVIALHHAGRDAFEGGMEINEFGEMKPSNRGILIKAIVKDLKGKSFKFDQ